MKGFSKQLFDTGSLIVWIMDVGIALVNISVAIYLLIYYWLEETKTREAPTNSDLFNVLGWTVALLCLLVFSGFADRYLRLRKIDKSVQNISKFISPITDINTGLLPKILFQAQEVGLVEIIDPGEKIPNFFHLFKQAKSVKLLAIAGENYGIGSDEFMSLLKEKLLLRQKVQIILADPSTELIKRRYKDENSVDPVGPKGLEARLEALYALHEELPSQCKKAFDVRVFNSYPTMSLAILDEHLFVYFYGMGFLGSKSPILHFVSLGKPSATYFIGHLNNVLSKAYRYNTSE